MSVTAVAAACAAGSDGAQGGTMPKPSLAHHTGLHARGAWSTTADQSILRRTSRWGAPQRRTPRRRTDTPVAEAARKEAEEAVQELDPATKKALQKIKRVYVAIHGIGDQSQYATIQQVANRLGKYYDVAAPVPLGSFHSRSASEVGFLFLETPPYDSRLEDVGLAEIYWADIPRAVQDEGYTLEEAKKWASSLAGRIRLHAEQRHRRLDPAVHEANNHPQLDPTVYETIEQVFGEMIEGVAVLDRLFFFLGKVTTFKFRLRDLLDSFLGDVQIVTDFEIERGKLLGHFNAVLDKISKANPDVDIYIVAHSEGTVVALLGLLTASLQYRAAGTGAEPQYRWLEQVRGLMTIGSPIEQHLLLWPDLFEPFEDTTNPETGVNPLACRWKPEHAGRRIQWRNYCDRADPIAYRLVETEAWLNRNGWAEVFEFDRARHEFVFSRYAFPGKAHNDYWEDSDVFGHFIDDVVKPPRVDGRTAEPKPPANNPFVALFSRLLPYVFPAMILFTGIFLLFRSVRLFLIGPNEDDTFGYTLRNAFGYWSLFAGLTLAARIPRLTRSRWAWGASLVMFLYGMVGYICCVCVDNQQYLTKVPVRSILCRMQGKTLADLSADLVYLVGLAGFVAVLLVLVWIAQVLAQRYPRHGARTLIIPGFAAVLLVAGWRVGLSISDHMRDCGSLWAMLLGGVAFVYLWWLAVVMFDLIFVWHHYVRGSARGATAVDRLRDMCAKPGAKA
jgi:hypothetical protein